MCSASFYMVFYYKHQESTGKLLVFLRFSSIAILGQMTFNGFPIILVVIYIIHELQLNLTKLDC